MTDEPNPNIKEDLANHEEELSTTELGKDLEFDRKLTKHERQQAWRRHAIFQAMVQGTTNTYELAQLMHISQSTAFRDVRFLQAQATEELLHHLSQRLPMQYKVSVAGILSIIQHAWSLALDPNGKHNPIPILALLASCYKDLLEMSTNAGIITDALQQITKLKDEIVGSNTSKGQSPQGEQAQ